MRPAPPWAVATLFFTSPSARWENVLWFSASGTFPAPYDSNADAAAVESHFEGSITSMMNEDSLFVGVKLTVNIGGTIFTGQGINNAGGTLNGGELPSEAAAVARVQSVHGGRTGRGRHYFGGLDEDDINFGRIQAPGSVPFSAVATALNSDITLPSGIVLHPSLWSRKDNALYSVVAVNFDSILGHRTKRRPRI